MASQQKESKTIPLKILVDRQSNKVVFVEATIDFVETLCSFLSLPLATIVRLLSTTNNNDQQQEPQSESLPFLGNIKNLYQSVQNIQSNDIWDSPVCKQMLLRPRNPFESMCNKLFLNIDDTDSSGEFFVCDSCFKFTTFKNLNCTCGKPPKRIPFDSESQGNNAQSGVFLKKSGSMFLVSDDLMILPSSMVSSMQLLKEMGYSELTQLEEVTHNIDKQEILRLLKYTLTSHEPLTNTIFASSSNIIENLPNQSASLVRIMPCISNKSKMDIKAVYSKSQKKIITTEDNGDFVDFIFSFLAMPLGSIVKLLGANSFAGCVGNLYKSLENLDPTSVLLNPGIAPQFGCPNQPLNISYVESLPTTYYYYGMKKIDGHYYDVIAKSPMVPIPYPSSLYLLDPRPMNMSKGVMGFMKRPALYGVGDDLQVKLLSANFFLSYLKELNLPFDDVEVKVISIGEAEALRFLAAFLTSKFTLTSGLQDFLNVPKIEPTFSKETELSISSSFSSCFQHFHRISCSFSSFWFPFLFLLLSWIMVFLFCFNELKS